MGPFYQRTFLPPDLYITGPFYQWHLFTNEPFTNRTFLPMEAGLIGKKVPLVKRTLFGKKFFFMKNQPRVLDDRYDANNPRRMPIKAATTTSEPRSKRGLSAAKKE
ncbi:hypothetical protein Ddc_24880 [Ditylenchus destructor]|nr:hypothetical protein Ddc_24880 [Ditylenchus destructor]